MSCPDCKEAARRRWHGMTDSCTQCRARIVGRLPAFKDSMTTGRQTGTYKDLLKVFRVEHEQVKESRAADFHFQERGCDG